MGWLLWHRARACWLCPWQDKAGRPVVSTSGKYVVRLYVCGAWRRVMIGARELLLVYVGVLSAVECADDRIPVDASNTPLYPRSAVDGELWPLLISKAVAAVFAGYGHEVCVCVCARASPARVVSFVLDLFCGLCL